MTHVLSGQLLQRAVRVAVVGCGGSGCAIAAGLPYLHQAMLVGGHPSGLAVTILDGDTISRTNCIRQPFSTNEIGLNKAVVMVSRLNLFWRMSWVAVPEYFTEACDLSRFDVVIGCVDTRGARRLLAARLARSRVTYWLDLGNSADSGQFILGEPLNGQNQRSATRLRTAAELLPEIIDATLDDDGLPSCGAVEALDRQEPFVNQVLAQHALAFLTRLFRYGHIEHHGAFINIATSRVQPIAIDPSLWRSLRRRGGRK